MRLRDADAVPGCLPGLRPDFVRDDRFFAGFFAHGASDNGERDEFDESADKRRSNSATSSCSRLISSPCVSIKLSLPGQLLARRPSQLLQRGDQLILLGHHPAQTSVHRTKIRHERR